MRGGGGGGGGGEAEGAGNIEKHSEFHPVVQSPPVAL